MIEAFQAANPGITVKHDTRPGVRRVTTWSRRGWPPVTCPMSSSTTTAHCCRRSSRSRTSTPLDDQPWAGQLDELFAASSKGSDGKLYGGPCGTAFGGGVLYNIPLYKKLGLEVPKTWDEFMANNEKIKEDGSASTRSSRPTGRPGRRSCSCSVTYHNVAAAVPTFAADYTANKAKYATTPAALAGFEHIQQVKDAGYFNKDFASAKLNDGVKAVATGTAAHYPQLGGTADEHRERRSGEVEGRRLLRAARR